MTSSVFDSSSLNPIIVRPSDDPAPKESEKSSGPLNTLESIFSLICRNNEILIMPKVMSDCGLIGGPVTMLVIGLLSLLASYSLCRSAQKLKVKSVIELCMKAYPEGTVFFNIFLMTLMVGTIVCSQVLIVDTISEISKLKKLSSVLANGYVIIGGLNLCMLFFSYSKTLRNVKIFSNIAFIGYFFAVVMIILHFFQPFFPKETPIDPKPKPLLLFSTKGVVSNLGLLFFSFTLQDVIVDFDFEMKPQTNSKSRKLTTLVVFGMFCSYMCCGVFGHLSIARDPKGLDQENFIRYLSQVNGGTSSWLIFGNAMICLNLLFDSVVSLVPITKFIDIFWLKSPEEEMEALSQDPSPEGQTPRSSVRRHVIKIFFVVVITGFLFLIIRFGIDLQRVYEIVSSLCIIPIALIFPLIFYKTCFPESMGKNTFYFLMGLSLALWGLTFYGCSSYF